jgi:NAD(P)-dependent dehydrogenase (short-subunit alcohol dehydrogenase family)
MKPVALISGARGGVARALSTRLRETGWELILVSRDPSGLDEGAARHRLQADLSSPSGAEQAFAQAVDLLGRPPDGYAHCAGNTLIAPLTRTSEAQYRAVLAANLDSAFFAVQAYVKQLVAAKQPGAMVLFSSVVAGIGVTNHAAIAAAKAGIEALTRSVAAEVSTLGIRINAVAPGLLRTPMTERMVASPAALAQINLQYPLGRHGEADEAAALAAWLLGPESAWMTGQVLRLDGGFSAVRPYLRKD